MTEVDDRLPRHVRRRRGRRTLVVIAATGAEVAQLQLEQSPWGGARVVPLVGRTDAELHAELAALSDVGLVIDLRGGSADDQLSSFEQLFFHLDPMGVWVTVRARRLPWRRDPVVGFVRRLQDQRARQRLDERWGPHARSLGQVRISRRLVVMGKKRQHLLRLREDDVARLLPRREHRVRVDEIARLDDGVVDTTGLMTQYGGDPDPRVPDLLRYPAHVARLYEGPVHLAKTSLVHMRRSVLPDSFRWHLAPDASVFGLSNVGEHFGRLQQRKPATTLTGSYYLFHYNNPGHFGHLMTEALSKLWGWDAAKAADPSLKILCRLHPRRAGESVERRLESTLLPAFGIAPEDIEWVNSPVTVTSLVGCTPMWHNAPPFYVHPGIREVWDRLRIGLMGSDPLPVAPRIFVTRRIGQRRCWNADAVEQLFASHGFEIVTPEALSLPEQVATFAGARVIAGFGGAGMFNLAYAASVETVVVLNQWAYQARNEHLFAAAHGARFHCFWSRPTHDHPPGGFSYRAHQSDWEFDFERNGAQLDQLLERLVE